MLNPMSLALGASGKAPPARGAVDLKAVAEGSPMAVSVNPDIKSRFIGSMVVGAAPKGWPAVESIGKSRVARSVELVFRQFNRARSRKHRNS